MRKNAKTRVGSVHGFYKNEVSILFFANIEKWGSVLLFRLFSSVLLRMDSDFLMVFNLHARAHIHSHITAPIWLVKSALQHCKSETIYMSYYDKFELNHFKICLVLVQFRFLILMWFSSVSSTYSRSSEFFGYFTNEDFRSIPFSN